MADNITIGRGKLYFSPYSPDTTSGGVRGYLGNTPSLTMAIATTKLDHYSSEGGLKVKDRSIVLQEDMTLTFDTDDVSIANLVLWFGGTNAGNTPSDAPTGLGDLAVIANADAIFGSLLYESDNPVGSNYNYWWPYVNLQPSGNIALKGDTWQTVTFSAECLKRDTDTARLYIFDPSSPAGNARSDVTERITAAGASVSSGSSLDAATSGTVIAPATGTEDTPITCAYTLAGGDAIAWAFLHTGSANVGTGKLISGSAGMVQLTPSTTGTFTVKVYGVAAGTSALLATSGNCVVS